MADTLVTQVLIIGGGIGGLTLGAILHKLNISYLVLERGSNAQPAGAGISLAPNCLRVLDQLGLYQDLQREAQEVKKILIHQEQTKWRELSFAPVADNFSYPVYAAERQFCSDLLYGAANGAETVILNAKVVEVDDDPALPFVSVTTADGRTFQAEVVVGADGIRSITRRLLARKAGMSGANTIQFTGRVHMSGYTAPLPNLGEQELGVGNWLFYDDNVVLTTWPCKDNRQWFICVQVRD
jgi:salicylate hydroxylase